MNDNQIKEELENYSKRYGRTLHETCNYLMAFVPKVELDKMTGKSQYEKAYIGLQVKNGKQLAQVMY